ncbi:hypothetical protein [Burkholderia phage BCSR129]|nr:hypothetical protein [Burkholderia phage BCSR129]
MKAETRDRVVALHDSIRKKQDERDNLEAKFRRDLAEASDDPVRRQRIVADYSAALAPVCAAISAIYHELGQVMENT